MNPVITIARKEVVDGLRDVRSVMASLFYALMGPAVVGLVAMATRANAKPEAESAVLTGMMAIFTLVSAFVGGMNVAMDTVAGERERRSLLPLLSIQSRDEMWCWESGWRSPSLLWRG
jgi:ABC-type Na+ efflux pump permease subunit